MISIAIEASKCGMRAIAFKDHWNISATSAYLAQRHIDDLIARGEKVYTANCAVCHKPDGKGGGPVKPLDGSAIVQDADKSKQIEVVLAGRLNGAMPSWKGLSDTDLAAAEEAAGTPAGRGGLSSGKETRMRTWRTLHLQILAAAVALAAVVLGLLH